MIKIRNVRKSFEEMEAVENVSIEVNKGSIYGLLGSNGAGKTTLLKLLAGIYVEDEGYVAIDGQPVFENPVIKERIFLFRTIPIFCLNIQLSKWHNFIKIFTADGMTAALKNLLLFLKWTYIKRFIDFQKAFRGRLLLSWLCLPGRKF